MTKNDKESSKNPLKQERANLFALPDGEAGDNAGKSPLKRLNFYGGSRRNVWPPGFLYDMC